MKGLFLDLSSDTDVGNSTLSLLVESGAEFESSSTVFGIELELELKSSLGILPNIIGECRGKQLFFFLVAFVLIIIYFCEGTITSFGGSSYGVEFNIRATPTTPYQLENIRMGLLFI